MNNADDSATKRRGSGLLSAFSSLVSGQFVATGAGFLFWVLAARLTTTGDVGIAGAAISTMALISTLSTMGFASLLIEELPRQGKVARELFASALLAVMAVSAIAGLIVAGGTILLQRFRSGGNLGLAVIDPLGAVLFVIGCAATTAASVADQAVLGLNKAGAGVMRNVLSATLRFPVLGVLALTVGVTATGMLASWVVPLMLSLAVLVFRLRLVGRRGGIEERATRWMAALRHWRRALAHHRLNLARAAAPMMVPVVAGAILTPVGAGNFMIAWQMAGVIFVPPYMLASALFSATANESVDGFAASLRRTLPLGVLISLVLAIGAWLGGGFVLSIFGAEFHEHATVLLWLLAPAGLWMVFKDHLAVLFRIEGRFGFASALATAALALELVGAVLGGTLGGPAGLIVGWLAAQGLEVLLAAPLVVRLTSLAWHGGRADLETGRRSRRP